jgi:hypothetical protein
MTKRCNSEYSYNLVKRCRFGYKRISITDGIDNGIQYCRCAKKCATCEAGSTNIKMHPELYEAFKDKDIIKQGNK